MADQIHIEEIEAQAALYALGALTSEETAHFRERVDSGCPFCMAQLRECRRTVAALPLAASEVAPPPSLRARLLERIGAQPPARESSMGEGILVRANDTEWKRLPVPGVEMRPLYGQKTFLVRMAPKSTIPAHPHGDAEQCLVLEGSVTSDGVTAYAGDFTYMPPGSSHHSLYSEDGCLFLITYT
jgi:mannose-6-phosphate isomerase-like protein (cupin superfamily)